MLKKMIVGATMLALAACGSLQKEVYSGAATLSLLENAATVYASWKDCSDPAAVKPLCSTQDIKDKIAKADNTAYKAVKDAEAKVNDPNATKDVVQGAVNAAEVALSALSALIPAPAQAAAGIAQ